MTSFLDVISHEDANDQSKLRQATALSVQRVEDRFGSFVRQGSVDDQAARFSLVEEDVRAVVAAACAQVGYPGGDELYKVIANNFVTGDATPLLRTASIRHEARKPKMCPYHSEVTDISLASGNPQDGFNAMAQHAWGAKHCQGDGYEGDRCKFKPAMTTQTYWDEKAEKAQERRELREQQAEQQAQAEDNVVELQTIDFEDQATQEDFVDGLAETDSLDSPEPSAIGEGVEEVPMSMAAKTAAPNEYVPSDDPNICPECGGEGETRCPACAGTGRRNASIKMADAGPVPKMDKRKWTPKTVPALTGVDDPNGKHPTKRKDVVEPITQKPDSPDNKSELKEIGEATTERQDVTKKYDGPSVSGQGGSFGGGDRSAVSSLLPIESVREAMSKFKRD